MPVHIAVKYVVSDTGCYGKLCNPEIYSGPLYFLILPTGTSQHQFWCLNKGNVDREGRFTEVVPKVRYTDLKTSTTSSHGIPGYISVRAALKFTYFLN
jgi:hypothetical protein